jgi:hypothetical protein
VKHLAEVLAAFFVSQSQPRGPNSLREGPRSSRNVNQPPDRQIIFGVADANDHDEPNEADHRYRDGQQFYQSHGEHLLSSVIPDRSPRSRRF